MGKIEGNILRMCDSIPTLFHMRRDQARSVDGNRLSALRRYLAFVAGVRQPKKELSS